MKAWKSTILIITATVFTSVTTLAETTKVYPASLGVVTSGGNATYTSYGSLENNSKSDMYIHLPIIHGNKGADISASSVTLQNRYPIRGDFYCSINSAYLHEVYGTFYGYWGKKTPARAGGIQTINTGALATNANHHQYIFCKIPHDARSGFSLISSYSVTER